jgi:hypothetical protein
MKEVRTTKKKTATYFFIHNEGDEDEVKLRIDLKQIDCEIPLYKSATFDFKKLVALKEENLTDTKQKLAAFDAKSREKIALEKELSQLNASLNKLMAVDSLARDSLAIDSIQKLKDQKAVEVSNTKKEAISLYKEYDGMMDNLMGNLRTNYKQRLSAAIEEAYQKIEHKETEFTSVDDDAKIWDIRLDLLKVDATREMLVPRRVDNQNITEKVTAGKQYYVLHFAEFGTMFEEEKVKKVFSAIKLWEFHLNPYLVDKQFGLVCDDQDRTQHYINSIVDYKNYSGVLNTVPREIKIIVDRYYEDDKQTFSRVDYNNDGISDGFIIERDGRPSGLETVSGKNKRIRAGTYNFEINSWASSSKTQKYINRTLRLSDVPGRSGILFHWGTSFSWSAGCLIGIPKITEPQTKGKSCTEEQSQEFVDNVIDYIRKAESEIKSTHKLDTVNKIIIINQNNL